jgi:hypothetical protein
MRRQRLRETGWHANDSLDRYASFGIVDGLIDLFERVERHQLIERKTPLAVKIDQARDKDVRGTFSSTMPRTLRPADISRVRSKVTSWFDAPTMPQTPRGASDSTAWRTTSALPVVSSA